MRLSFDPQNPFPLLAEGAVTPAEAANHAEAVDQWLSIRVEEVEAALEKSEGKSPVPGMELGSQLWIGTPSRIFQTPYLEIRRLLSQLDPKAGEKVIDLGAAYGRVGFVLARHYPEVEFVGYEILASRVEEGTAALERHFQRSRSKLVQADLSAEGFQLERADYYFIYDFGTLSAIAKTLSELREIAREKPITVIGRGRASRDTIELSHPWLAQVNPPRHFANYSIYRS